MGTLYVCHCLTHFASGIWKCLYLWAKSQRSKTKMIKHFPGRNRKKWRNMSLKWKLMLIRHISLKKCCFQIQLLLATYSHIRSSTTRCLKCDIAHQHQYQQTTSNQTTIFRWFLYVPVKSPCFFQELQLNLSRAHRLHLLRLVAPQLTLLKMPPMTVTTSATPRRVCLTCDRPRNAVETVTVGWPGLVNVSKKILELGPIYSGFTRQKWWFSIAMLVYHP